MSIKRVSVNGRAGIAVGIGQGPNTGKRAVLWDDDDTMSWVPSGDVMSVITLDRV